MIIKIDKQQLLQQLYAPYQKCNMCPLGNQGRTNVVFGEGNLDADIFFIGEAPGKEENATGLPFQGKSGKLLNKVLDQIGIKRTNIFISNIVKCRPPRNRKPLFIEIATCKKLLLLNQIAIINPKILCTLGSVALEGLLEQKIKMSEQRGKPIKFNTKIIIPTYHPAYIIRNPKFLETFINDLNLAIKTSQETLF